MQLNDALLEKTLAKEIIYQPYIERVSNPNVVVPKHIPVGIVPSNQWLYAYGIVFFAYIYGNQLYISLRMYVFHEMSNLSINVIVCNSCVYEMHTLEI